MTRSKEPPGVLLFRDSEDVLVRVIHRVNDASMCPLERGSRTACGCPEALARDALLVRLALAQGRVTLASSQDGGIRYSLLGLVLLDPSGNLKR